MSKAKPKKNHKRKVVSRIVIALLALIVVCVAATLIYMKTEVGYPQDDAKAALKSDDTVMVTSVSNVTTFAGPDTDSANTYGFVFYQGAKVEADAYAPLLHQLAAQGWTCVTIDMPLNFAMFDMDAADRLMADHPEVEHWYIGGHSLGGLVASQYASSHISDFEGLVLLGSYTNKDLSSGNFDVATIYGTNDMVLNRDSYQNGLAYLPAGYKETVIEGGNHAQFGDYGNQAGDGEATISAQDQLSQTIAAIQALR